MRSHRPVASSRMMAEASIVYHVVNKAAPAPSLMQSKITPCQPPNLQL